MDETVSVCVEVVTQMFVFGFVLAAIAFMVGYLVYVMVRNFK